MDAFLFLVLCGSLSTVHVLVTLRQRQDRSIPKEVLTHYVCLTGLIIAIGGLIQGLSLLFQ